MKTIGIGVRYETKATGHAPIRTDKRCRAGLQDILNDTEIVYCPLFIMKA